MRKNVVLSIISLLWVVAGYAQQSPSERALSRAISLYNYGHLIEAREELLAVSGQLKAENDKFALEKADYYLALCDSELKLKEAEQRMKSFLSTYAGSSYSNDVQFGLGVYYCMSEDLEAAEEAFNNVNYRTLDTRNRDKYDLRMGYMAFMKGDYKSATLHFQRIESKSLYSEHAVYYLSYMAYAEGDIDKARKGFESLLKSVQYGDLMPYYLLQLDFREGKYESVVEKGDDLMKRTTEEYATEIKRIMAESYFQLSDYKNAVSYMNSYRTSGGEMGRVENYIIGYSLYRQTLYAEADSFLREACGADDMLTQNASYHLADCYLKLGDKPNALISFAMSAGSDFDKNIAEDALFNYAKLQYELDDGLFNKTINVLTRYVEEYPSSQRVQEAKALLVAAYYNSNNYDQAYQAISRIANPDNDILVAKQKIAYFMGLEAYNSGDLEEAEVALNESFSIGLDSKYKALATFWMGEIAYSRGDIEMAQHNYKRYMAVAPKSAREYAMAQYNMGYCYFNAEEYDNAGSAFDEFLKLYSVNDGYKANALNRRGDVAYANREFEEAVAAYDKAIALEGTERYYAQYQKAITLGAQGKVQDKISVLKGIVSRDRGDYVGAAYYELGRTYISKEDYQKGVATLKDYVEKYPDSDHYAQALSDLGLAYANLGDKQEALKYYDKVIKSAPQSSQSKGALEGVREIYMSDGNAEAYFDYAESIGMEGDLSVVARDSMSYASAQKLYLDKKIESAAKGYESYLRNYPDGHYLNDALFFLSDCYIRAEKYSKAIETLTRLHANGDSQYSEKVLDNLSYLCYQAERYAEAAKAYRELYDKTTDAAKRKNAASGYISSVLKYADDSAILTMAEDMEKMPEVTDVARRKARYAKAGALTRAGKQSEALEVYRQLAAEVKSAEGAESYYRVVEAMYADEKYDEAEQMILKFAESKTPQNYWLAKAFMVLGDIYAKKGDAFQARSTYQSVVDGYTPNNDGIVDEAKARIAKLN